MVDWYMSSYDSIVELNTDQNTDLNYLHKVGYKKAAWYIGTIWIEGERFNELNSLCESLQKRNEIEPFFKKIFITGDGKWINTIICGKDCGASCTNNGKNWIDTI